MLPSASRIAMLSHLVGLILVFFAGVHALPLGEHSLDRSLTVRTTLEGQSGGLHLAKRYEGTPAGPTNDDGPDSSNYPGDDELRAGISNDFGTIVFYSNTADNGQSAFDWASRHSGKSYRDVYDQSLITIAEAGPNQDRGPKWFPNFVDRFSGVLADSVTQNGQVLSRAVIIAPRNPSNSNNGIVRGCSVWNRIEWGTLMANSNIQTVSWIAQDNLDDSNGRTIWDRIRNIRADLDTTGESGNCVD